MVESIPDYSKFFDITKRRLNGMERLAKRRDKEKLDEDTLIFLLLRNMNLRINTMFHLVRNGILDGVFPLQRSFYEMEIAFQSYINADNKKDYIELYAIKGDFEDSIKTEKLLNGKKELYKSFKNNDQRKLVTQTKEDSQKKIKEKTALKKPQPFKLWFEHASGYTLKEISDAHFDEVDYYSYYDEPSNWVHSQRLEENLNIESSKYMGILLYCLRWDFYRFTNDVVSAKEYFQISGSKQLLSYGEKAEEFDEKLRDFMKSKL